MENNTHAPQPTTQDLMTMIMELKASNEQLQKAAIAKVSGKSQWKFMCKPNAKNGLFMQVSGVKSISKEGKPYSPSMNIHAYQLGTLLEILKTKQYREAAIKCIEKGEMSKF